MLRQAAPSLGALLADTVQGHLLNGVAAGSVCAAAASSYTGRFIHIEQDPNFHAATDWIASVEDTLPVGRPVAPTGVTAVAGHARVSLGWTSVVGATSYGVHRSTTSGGPYPTVASGVKGVSYSYVVTAMNAAGESAPSTQARAKAE